MKCNHTLKALIFICQHLALEVLFCCFVFSPSLWSQILVSRRQMKEEIESTVHVIVTLIHYLLSVNAHTHTPVKHLDHANSQTKRSLCLLRFLALFLPLSLRPQHRSTLKVWKCSCKVISMVPRKIQLNKTE